MGRRYRAYYRLKDSALARTVYVTALYAIGDDQIISLCIQKNFLNKIKHLFECQSVCPKARNVVRVDGWGGRKNTALLCPI